MSQLLFIVVAIAIMALLLWGWVLSMGPFQANQEGWNILRPSPSLYMVLAGAAAFSLLLIYVRLFVGSARPDADEQMLFCLLTAAGFIFLACILAYQMFWKSVQWKGRALRTIPILGSPGQFNLDDLEWVGCRTKAGMFDLHFRTGNVVKVSVMMKGTRELLDSLGTVSVRYLR